MVVFKIAAVNLLNCREHNYCLQRTELKLLTARLSVKVARQLNTKNPQTDIWEFSVMNSSDFFPEFCMLGSVNGQAETRHQMAHNSWLFLFCSL